MSGPGKDGLIVAYQYLFDPDQVLLGLAAQNTARCRPDDILRNRESLFGHSKCPQRRHSRFHLKGNELDSPFASGN